MKKLNLIYVIAALAVLFVSCEPDDPVVPEPQIEIKTTIIDFEDVALSKSGITTATFTSNNFKFLRNGANSWDGGFTASNLTDTTTVGYTNDNSAAAGKGALNSTQYAVGFVALFTNGLDTINFPEDANGNYTAKSIMLTNNTYAYRGMKYGEYGGGEARKFVAGDWFKVTIQGFLNKTKTNEVDYYLADFRDGKSFIAKDWQKVDISALGEIDQMVFTVSSSDTGAYGVNTPSYFCIDNLELTQEITK